MVKAGQKLMIGLGMLLLSLALSLNAQAMPDTITLDVLAELYDGVIFDHDMHTMMTESCSVCHHHTAGPPVVDSYCAKCHDGSKEVTTVSCQDCHSNERVTAESMHLAWLESPFHDDVPDLKAAYHLSCIGCHQEIGAPVGCVDCHNKTEAGHRYYHSGEFAPTQSPR